MRVEDEQSRTSVLRTKDENKAPEGPGRRPASIRGGALCPQTLPSGFQTSDAGMKRGVATINGAVGAETLIHR